MCSKGFVKATFEKSSPCLSQYSNAENISQAMMLSEKSLRLGKKSPTNGNTYFIVDGGHPVENFGFWFPLFDSLGQKRPSFKIPYFLVYYLAFLSEILYYTFKIEPLFTRFEVNLLALTNTYSIKKAVKDFGYKPVNNHCLKNTIDYYSSQQISGLSKRKQSHIFPGEVFWSKLFMFIAIAVISSFIWPFLGTLQKVSTMIK